ncbi:ABC transporter permease [Escherichia coli]|uniref:ABC transporter permease n=1 Tax=Escherichia coli TaxID=562 RepID=A0A376W577_ECOLX|nr:ABC transporter permease [Escherichia coli]
MNLLTLSDDEARSLGLNVTRLRFGLIVCATLITASTVAIAGIIGWVGLVVPHIARLLTGHNHQQLLPHGNVYWARFCSCLPIRWHAALEQQKSHLAF